MDGLKQLRPQQATEWYYPNMMSRVMWLEQKKKIYSHFILLCLLMWQDLG